MKWINKFGIERLESMTLPDTLEKKMLPNLLYSDIYQYLKLLTSAGSCNTL